MAEFKKMNVNIYNNRVEVSKVLAVNRYVLITVIGFKKVAEILKKITLFNLWFWSSLVDYLIFKWASKLAMIVE